MSLLAFVHQSTIRWLEPSFGDPSAQAQNSPAAFGFDPRALATKAQPPPIVRYFPPGGMGSLKTPYLKSGAPSRNCAIAQMPKFCLDAAMERHAVLIFRDQPLSDEQQLAFTLQFGQLER